MNDKTSIFLDIAPELSDSEGALRLHDRFLHDENAPLTLRLDDEGLSLQADGQVLRGDFVKMLPRVKPGMPAHEMLVKTAKIKNSEGPLTAVDATAGLGEDSILLGLNAPINDLSRGCNAQEVYSMAIITAALAD